MLEISIAKKSEHEVVARTPHFAERQEFCKHLVEGYRISVRLGIPPRCVPTFWTVALGLLSGRPMTASDAAEILSVPRATVQRHILELEKLEFVVTERQGNRLLLHSSVSAQKRFSSEVNKFLDTEHYSF